MKLVFFGSDDFAQAHLQTLLDSSHKVVACVTQPDRPKGRGMKMHVSPVKEVAHKHNITVLQPDNLSNKEFVTDLRNAGADLFIVIAYGRFLTKEILGIPRKYCINVHASLLPAYRGAAPINWAIIKGEKETGVTLIKMNEKMDAGEIISQEKVEIDDKETSQILREKLKLKGCRLLLETLEEIAKGDETFQKQNKEEVSFAPKLTKSLGVIQWDASAVDIDRLVRGLNPWPGAYTKFQGKTLKILESAVIDDREGDPGEVVETDDEGILVGTGRGSLLVTKVHLESSKPMSAKEFLVGHKIEKGFRFAE